MATPAAANKGPRTAINRHSRGTSSRHESDATVTRRQLPTSTGASGGAIVPTAIPADSTTAHRSSLTGGLRSRSGPALDGGKGLYLLQRSRSYAGNLLECTDAVLQTRPQRSRDRKTLRGGCHLQSEHPVDLVAFLAGEFIQRIGHGLEHRLDEHVPVLLKLLGALPVAFEHGKLPLGVPADLVEF